MDPFEFEDRILNKTSEHNNSPEEARVVPKQSAHVDVPHTLHSHTFVTSERKSGKFVYVSNEKCLYSINSTNKYGEAYRCSIRSCKSRVIIISSGDCIKLDTSPPHHHETNHEERFKRVAALDDVRKGCADLATIASGSRISDARAVYKSVIGK